MKNIFVSIQSLSCLYIVNMTSYSTCHLNYFLNLCKSTIFLRLVEEIHNCMVCSFISQIFHSPTVQLLTHILNNIHFHFFPSWQSCKANITNCCCYYIFCYNNIQLIIFAILQKSNKREKHIICINKLGY